MKERFLLLDKLIEDINIDFEASKSHIEMELIIIREKAQSIIQKLNVRRILNRLNNDNNGNGVITMLREWQEELEFSPSLYGNDKHFIYNKTAAYNRFLTWQKEL